MKPKLASVTFHDNFFGRSYLARTVGDLQPDTDLVILWGGTDICPMIYGETNRVAQTTEKPTMRDLREMHIVEWAQQRNIPILGICRGAQLLCAMDGGRLWQHADNHAGKAHPIVLRDGRQVESNSAHHQIMVPGDNAYVLAVADKVYSPIKVGEHGPVEDNEEEVEIAHFPRLNALGIQGHPEWLNDGHDFVTLTINLVREYLNVDFA